MTDNGPGIPADQIKQVMEPFFTTKPRGLGLGLAISRSIVEKNRGDLRVFSQPGSGSTFLVRLPAALTPAAEGHAFENELRPKLQRGNGTHEHRRQRDRPGTDAPRAVRAGAVPRRPARGDRDGSGRPRRPLRDADRRRQEPLLPVAGPASAGRDAGGQPLDRPDEGSGRRAVERGSARR